MGLDKFFWLYFLLAKRLTSQMVGKYEISQGDKKEVTHKWFSRLEVLPIRTGLDDLLIEILEELFSVALFFILT